MASQILKRLAEASGLSDVRRRFNSVVDMLNGNLPGRIKLHGDDGVARNPIGGATVSSANYALDVKAASGLHGQFTHSTGSPIILAIADSGNVTASAINSGDVGVTGNLTFVGAARRILADLSNATVANRLLIQSSTVNGDTRLALIPNGASVITQLALLNSATTTAATGGVMAATSGGVNVGCADFGGGYLPLNFVNGGAVRAGISTAGVMHAAVALVVGGTALSGTEELRVIGQTRLEGDTAVTTGALTVPATDPPTGNTEVTAGSQAKAWAYFTVSGGAVNLRDSYNVTSVTYNAAGNFSVVWDRDFSSSYYACLPSVEDNGAALLTAKVNSQASTGADIHVYNVAAALTDPDAISVIAFGTLS